MTEQLSPLPPMSRSFGVADALLSLTPGAQWVLRGDGYEGLEWMDETQVQPTEETVYQEINNLQAAHDSMAYARNRSAEYPDFLNYIDGIVKGDQEQVDKYIADCLAIKEKYPKPEELAS
jgi:hypothetical protein